MSISVNVVADSISSINGKRITTFEVEFPRLILAEWNTHRLFSRNAASTRAIPILKQLDVIAGSPAMPVFYGKNQSGMIAKEEVDAATKEQCESVIEDMLNAVVNGVTKLNELGLHKQHSGRYLEPWIHVKGVVTSTEWDNFFWLRKHSDAQPEIKLLAEKMWESLEESNPVTLEVGEWHTPYYGAGYWIEGLDDSLEDALAISMSCCAQVSYRVLDDSLEKAKRVVERLNLDGADGNPVHSSPSEHQATPMKGEVIGGWYDNVNIPQYPETWEEGITALHKELGLMSGNFAGWIQQRQLIKGHTKW